MAKEKVYKCCICGCTLKNEKTTRLTKELYGLHYRGGHYPVEHYDFCNKCYTRFNNWIKKYEEENRNESS